MSHEPQQRSRPRRWAAGAATLALAATGFSALSTTTAPATASATGFYRPTAPCYLPQEEQRPPSTYELDNFAAPDCGTWRLVPVWNPFPGDIGPGGEKMLAQLLWEHSGNVTVDKYNIYRDGHYYDTAIRYGSFGSYYDRAPTSDNHVYQIVSVFETDSGNKFSSKSAPLVKRG